MPLKDGRLCWNVMPIRDVGAIVLECYASKRQARLCCNALIRRSRIRNARNQFTFPYEMQFFLHRLADWLAGVRLSRVESRRKQSQPFSPAKWHGLLLQWQHCLKEDMHKIDTAMPDRNLPKVPYPTNESIHTPLRLSDLSLASCIWLGNYCACRGWEGGGEDWIQLGF
jgi:hypothetical protein